MASENEWDQNSMMEKELSYLQLSFICWKANLSAKELNEFMQTLQSTSSSILTTILITISSLSFPHYWYYTFLHCISSVQSPTKVKTWCPPETDEFQTPSVPESNDNGKVLWELA